ncbi:hypothetical protein [Gabonibacter massiliensis]|uniref:hypothetical protein n=1 Tax=Gabonibacter massiliensis TaxID=1720195 RepID=UPI0011C8FD6F|nr:hypothetical protein [Gabonibacter massiliensis]
MISSGYPSGDRDVPDGRVDGFRSLVSGTRFARTFRRPDIPETACDACRSLFMFPRFILPSPPFIVNSRLAAAF